MAGKGTVVKSFEDCINVYKEKYKPVEREKKLPEQQLIKPEDGDDEYNLNYQRRGFAVIINNEEFTNADNRDGSEKDVEHLEAIFRNLDFDVKTKRNLTSVEMEVFLQEGEWDDAYSGN